MTSEPLTIEEVRSILRFCKGSLIKLRRELMRRRGWKSDVRGAPHDDWYRNWTALAPLLNEALNS